MGILTLRRLASLQKSFAITAFVGLCYAIALRVFESQTDCKLDATGEKPKGCMLLLHCRNSSEDSEFHSYVRNQRLWIILLLSAILNGLLWAGFQVTKHAKLANGICPHHLQSTSKNSGFTEAATLVYVITSSLCLILPFVWFQFTVSSGRFASFAIDWLQNFSDGKPLLAREINCEFRRLKPVEEVTVTCKLLMNSHFEFIYLVLWFWFVLLVVVNFLVLLQCVLFSFSSTLRFRRLSALLEGMNKQKISELAQDADAFFKIESYAGETVELKGQQLWYASTRN